MLFHLSFFSHHSTTMSITMISQPSLFYTKTKFPFIISNSVKPFKLQNPSSHNNSSMFSHPFSLTTIRRRTQHSSLLTFVGENAEWAKIIDFQFGSSTAAPSEDLKVFVTNFPSNFGNYKLITLFEQAGIVVNANLIYFDSVGDKNFACVTMSTVEDVEKAVNKFNGYELNGKLLSVNREDPRKANLPTRPHVTSFKLYVTNLPRDVDSARLEEIFSKYGKVESVELVCNKVTGKTLGYGFVTMSNETDMYNAIDALDGKNFGGIRSLGVTNDMPLPPTW